MNNKKALSAVVATVLIILMSVAAVAIIWAAVMPMIREPLEGGVGCMEAEAQVSLLAGYTCINKTGNYTDVNVKHDAKDVSLSAIQIQILSGGNSYSVDYRGGNLPDPNNDRVIRVNRSEFSGNMTDAQWNAVSQIAIAPKIQKTAKETLCNKGSTMDLTEC